MAYATYSHRALDGASLWQRLGELRTGLAERVTRYQAYRATLNELAALTDRELNDLGIARGQIRSIARTAADAV